MERKEKAPKCRGFFVLSQSEDSFTVAVFEPFVLPIEAVERAHIKSGFRIASPCLFIDTLESIALCHCDIFIQKPLHRLQNNTSQMQNSCIQFRHNAMYFYGEISRKNTTFRQNKVKSSVSLINKAYKTFW